MCHKILFDVNLLAQQKGNLRAALWRVSMKSSGDLVGAGENFEVILIIFVALHFTFYTHCTALSYHTFITVVFRVSIRCAVTFARMMRLELEFM